MQVAGIGGPSRPHIAAVIELHDAARAWAAARRDGRLDVGHPGATEGTESADGGLI